MRDHRQKAGPRHFNEILFGAGFVETTCWMGVSIN